MCKLLGGGALFLRPCQLTSMRRASSMSSMHRVCFFWFFYMFCMHIIKQPESFRCASCAAVCSVLLLASVRLIETSQFHESHVSDMFFYMFCTFIIKQPQSFRCASYVLWFRRARPMSPMHQAVLHVLHVHH